MTARKPLLAAALAAAGVLALLALRYIQPDPLPAGFAGSNGRIEAVEIDVATKTAGRLVEVLVDEGDYVSAGQVLARMDTEALEAQLREAQAERRRAETAVDTARSGASQRESEKAAAQSVVAQREAELELARSGFSRAENLQRKGAMSREDFDTHRAAFFSARAALDSARASVAGADAAIATAKSQIIEAEASVGAAQAKIERLQADIRDSQLSAPRDARVQYRIAQPGEVLGGGGKVLSLVDLADVYMTFFLPTAEAGRVRIGAEARIVLDAVPGMVIPARVSFVADVAQFTPKSVETEEERLKLMFRVKARVDPGHLERHRHSVKTGLPGMAYVQLDPQAPWPAGLQPRMPP